MKTWLKVLVWLLVFVAYMAFPGFDWRHVLLLVAQACIVVA